MKSGLLGMIGMIAMAITAPVKAQAGPATAAGNADPATGHLVIEYKSDPRHIVALRQYMQQKALARLRVWQAKGVLTGFKVLMADHSIKTLPDMYIMLDFARFTDIERWQQIEHAFPGGLDAEGLELAEPTSTIYADVPWMLHRRGADHRKTVYMIIPYTILSSVEQYSDYAGKYVTAQFDAWSRLGIISGYDLYLNQNPVQATWDSLAVLEYRDMAALAQREGVKQQVRAQIKDLPGYKQYAPIKATIRSEHLGALYEDLAER